MSRYSEKVVIQCGLQEEFRGGDNMKRYTLFKGHLLEIYDGNYVEYSEAKGIIKKKDKEIEKLENMLYQYQQGVLK